MIMGSLVSKADVGNVDSTLDDSLGRVFLNEFATNETINAELLKNPVIMKELNAAVAAAYTSQKSGGGGSCPLAIAKGRYASGDITRETYLQICKDLG
ncbi:hypothetical protein OAX78_03240 [Planctomycetota bacterium]|nr:hypothetical protein [Planctomycetota bacterium]